MVNTLFQTKSLYKTRTTQAFYTPCITRRVFSAEIGTVYLITTVYIDHALKRSRNTACRHAVCRVLHAEDKTRWQCDTMLSVYV